MTSDTKSDTQSDTNSSVVALVVGLTALVGGLAFYLGWTYEREYVREWELSFGAFSYEPHELVVGSPRTLMMAIFLAMPIAVGLFAKPLIPKLEDDLDVPDWAMYVLLAAAVVCLIGALVANYLTPANGSIAIVVAFIVMLALDMVAAFIHIAGSKFAGSLLFFAQTLLLVLLVVFSPGLMGRSDAIRDKNDISRLPLVELTPASSESADISGTWRVVRINNDVLWLVADAVEARDLQVTQVAFDEVQRIRYVPDD